MTGFVARLTMTFFFHNLASFILYFLSTWFKCMSNQTSSLFPNWMLQTEMTSDFEQDEHVWKIRQEILNASKM